MVKFLFVCLWGASLAWNVGSAFGESAPLVLTTEALADYVSQFNANDEEMFSNIKNKDAFAFLENNIPLFDCPDEDFRRTYYFRWWMYRKHVKKTEDGYVVTEFMPPVGWAGKHNTISCPAAHHFYEGRWLHDPRVMDDYATFWLRNGGSPRSYSFWIADAYYNRNLVTPNDAFLIDLLPDLVENYRAWEKGWSWPGKGHKHECYIGQRANGLFYTIDDRDGGEASIGKHGFRPTLNSFMYGDAKAIAAIARMAGKADIAADYDQKAATLKKLIQEKLWDPEAQFFKILSGPRMANKEEQHQSKLTDVRELYGYTPWYFNLPDPGYEAGWKELMDPRGFYAKFGPTFAEQRHPEFKLSYEGHECQWNGPSWPLATCSVLTALANLLNNYEQDVIGKAAYFETLTCYTRSHQLVREDGKVVPWIDENIHPYTGDWIARTRLHEWAKSDPEWAKRKGGHHRGKDYNHSTYNDLIITGLVGLRPRADDTVVINPLLPEGTWDYFCLDNVLYHGNILTILWDRTGEKYGKGQGLTLFIDGQKAAHAETLTRITATLPAAAEVAPPQPHIALQPIFPAVKEAYYRAADPAPHAFVDEAYRIWGVQVIRWTDGKYHAYFSRWKKEYGFHGWIRWSEIAHAVADRPEGPFRTTGTVLSNRNADGWDVVNAHNPSVCVADDRICLYYISNDLSEAAKKDGERMPPSEAWLNKNGERFRNSQRIGLAVSNQPEGPFIRTREPVVQPDNRIFKNVACNPAVHYADGRYTMIMKGDDVNQEGWFRIQLVGHSDRPEGPFVFQEKPIYDKKQTEDACIWYDQTRRQYNSIVHVFGSTLGRLISEDGIQWREAEPFTFTPKEFVMTDGSIWKPTRVERPFVLTNEKGVPEMLYLAVWDHQQKLNGNIAVPLKTTYKP